MGQLLAKTKAPKGPSITDTDKAILSLKAQRKKLQDQQKLMELRLSRHDEVARELVREKQRSRALLVLKKKKLVEKHLDELNNLQFNTENMIVTVEMTKQTNKVFAVLKQGNEVMQVLQKEVTVDDVRKLMDDTAESKAYQDEIAAALNQSMTADDSDAIAAELKALEEEDMMAEVGNMAKAPAIPDDYKAKQQKVAAGAGPAATSQADKAEVEQEVLTRIALHAS